MVGIPSYGSLASSIDAYKQTSYIRTAHNCHYQ